MKKPLKGVKILIGPSVFGVYDSSPLDRLAKAGCEIIANPYKRRLTKDELLELLSDDVAGLIAGLEPLDKEVLEKTKLKVISRCGSGISNIDLKVAKKLRIKICYTPNGPTSAVAELTIGAMISLLRQIPQMNMDLHGNKWIKRAGVQLEGKTVVIVGLGRIGKKVATLLKSFNVNLIAVEPSLHKNENGSADGIKLYSLARALPIADIITIHASGEHQIIGSNEFRLIKEGVFLLNAARGGLIDEQSLIQALENGKIRGAWLDTFNCEPYSGLLKKYPQVILTPHAGSYTIECRKSMEIEAVRNLIDYFKNQNTIL